MSDKQLFTKEEKQLLENFKKQSTEMEEIQIAELDYGCNVSFQYAKTYSNYVKDWEKTKKKMLDQLETGNLPPDTSPEFHKEVIEIGDCIIKDKLRKVRKNFERKFGKSIFNYLRKDGKTKGCLGIFLFFIFTGTSFISLLI